MSSSTIEIAFCMGSSCFSRGSSRGLALLQDYLRKKGIEDRVSIRGQLCQGRCQDGPNIMINRRAYPAVDAGVVLDLVKLHLERECEGCNLP